MYRYAPVPPRFRDQLRHHKLHHLSISSSDGEEFSAIDEGLIWRKPIEPRHRLLPANFEPKPSTFSQDTVTDDDDPASQFYISQKSLTPYHYHHRNHLLRSNFSDQNRALSLCDEATINTPEQHSSQNYHRSLPNQHNLMQWTGIINLVFLQFS